MSINMGPLHLVAGILLVGASCGPASQPARPARPAAPAATAGDPCKARAAELARQLREAEQESEQQKIAIIEATAARRKALEALGDIHRTAGLRADGWRPGRDPNYMNLEEALDQVMKSDCAGRLERVTVEPSRIARPPLLGFGASVVAKSSRLSIGSCLVRAVWSLGRIVRVDSLRLVADARGSTTATLRFTVWREQARDGSREPLAEVKNEPLPRCAGRDLRVQAIQVAVTRNRLVTFRAQRKHADAELAVVRALNAQLLRQEKVLAVLDMAVQGDLAPAAITLDGRSLKISGTVHDRGAFKALKSIRIAGSTVNTGGLTLRPLPAAVDPSKLPRWPAQKGTGSRAGRIQLHAQDADGDVVQLLLSNSRRQVMIRSGRNIRVTGQLAAGSNDDALAALLARYAALGKDAAAAPSTIRRRWRGRKIDMSFTRADVGNVLRLLGDVGRVNLVHRPIPASLNLWLHNVPWDWTLHALAARLDLDIEQRGGVWFLRSRTRALPKIPSVGKGRVNIWLSGVRAADALTLLASGGRVPVTAACQSGGPVTLRLRGARRRTVAAAVGFLSDAKLVERKRRGGQLCASTAAAGSLALLGTLSGKGIRQAALVRTAEGKLRVVRRGDALGEERIDRILDPDRIVLKNKRGEDRVLTPPPGPRHVPAPRVMHAGRREAPDLRGMRLSATLIDGRRCKALFESEAGDDVLLILQRRHDVTITAGRVELRRRARLGLGAQVEERREVHLMRRLP